MTSKRCPGCARLLALETFAKNRRKKDGRQTYCRTCKKATDAAYYRRDEGQQNERNRQNRQRNREYVWAHLSAHPCLDCGEPDPVVLEFDHVRGQKVRAIGDLINRAASLETLRTEMAKCEVRCANCHRRKTAADQRWTLLRRLDIERPQMPLPLTSDGS